MKGTQALSNRSKPRIRKCCYRCPLAVVAAAFVMLLIDVHAETMRPDCSLP